MPAGQPTKYSPEMLAEAEAYIEHYAERGDVVPSVIGMALDIGVCEATLYNWGNEHPEFLETLKKCKGTQHRKLLSGGLSNTMNAAITKLMLANHGYSDKTENTLQGPDGGPIEVDQHWTIEVVSAEDADTQ